MLEITAPQPPPVPPPYAQPPSAQPSSVPPLLSAPDTRGVSFHDVLSALNPLQYLPVVGTIYRAVTGDELPEPVRRVGSAIGSLLTGGPIGLMVNIAMLGAEKASGIDLDAIGQSLLRAKPAAGTAAALPALAQPAGATPASPLPWSPARGDALAEPADGATEQNDLSGADRLNAWELTQIHGALSAYERTLDLAG